MLRLRSPLIRRKLSGHIAEEAGENVVQGGSKVILPAVAAVT